MSDIIRIFRPAPYRAERSQNPFRLLPNVAATPRSEPPQITIEGVPPIPQKREMPRNET